MKFLALLVLIFLPISSFADSCEQPPVAEIANPNLLKIITTTISERMDQIDISAPTFIDGKKIKSAQLLQTDKEKPFFLVLLSLPFADEERAATQIFSAPGMFIGGEVQVWYGSDECPTLLRGEIT
ncbi:hypothetical protein [Microbulbifer hydrolyticus]|uniref:Uncharacterized protein n=1 Tax=Microbulbifer hydrolyticus TaxID=48074 RepID=A0A6P1TBN2_9GAMM|nr:hypothetical protein [Microbulbifer hydrolyticus]MBB5212555.1 hypothetical protein [Microbulbifer hydrolyticus]QHQ40174.1 hypothetical protein GTQ55_15090 [Microbulbifer hydrolyticus]